MTKKLFFIALAMLSISILYYSFQKLQSYTVNKATVRSITIAQNSATIPTTTSEFEGIYTATGEEKECNTKRMTLEALASSTSYLTEEFVNCKIPVEMKSWNGTWQEADGKFVVDIKNGEQSQKFDLSVDRSGDAVKLSSAEPKLTFIKTNFKNYKSKYKNISVEYGQYGEEYFARLWSLNGVLLASLMRDINDNTSYTDGAYVWKVGATSTLLSASSTNETFVEQSDEQN
jgi:membrane-bound inhibitor of C-type lysozyme